MIRFIVHGGHGKAATTFFRTKIHPHLEDVLYLGRYLNASCRMLTPELDKTYYDLFPAFGDVVDHRAQNSALLIAAFGDEILQEIHRSDKKIVLIANTFFEYSAYNAELNQLLLLKLFRYLQDNCPELIAFKVMLNIRNQKDILQSFQAENFHTKRFKTFGEFIQYGKENSYKNIFGGYHYGELLSDMRYLYGSHNVRFFLFEQMKENMKAYLQDVLDFIGSEQDIRVLEYTEKLNMSQENGRFALKHGRHNSITSMIQAVYLFFKPWLKCIEEIGYFKAAKAGVKKYHQSTYRIARKGYVEELTLELSNVIDNIYRGSNSKLAKLLNKDLEKYGYTGGKL